jgi:hypothetical protein
MGIYLNENYQDFVMRTIQDFNLSNIGIFTKSSEIQLKKCVHNIDL